MTAVREDVGLAGNANNRAGKIPLIRKEKIRARLPIISIFCTMGGGSNDD